MAYAIGYWIGTSIIPALIFGFSAKKSGSRSGNIGSSILLIIFLPLVGFCHLSGVKLYNIRHKDSSMYPFERLEELHNSKWISHEEFKKIKNEHQFYIGYCKLLTIITCKIGKNRYVK